MFEKEAEEAGNEKIKGNYQFARCARKSYKDGFKDGAEFGYSKANEWHKVADGGGLPKNNTAVLVILKNKRMKISTFMENKFTIWNNDYDAYTKLYDVIAWCEIPTFKE